MGLAWQMEMRRHLKEHRPKMYRELLKAGTLDKVTCEASERAGEMVLDLIEQGVPPWEAQREARVQHLLLPSGADQPELVLSPESPEGI